MGLTPDLKYTQLVDISTTFDVILIFKRSHTIAGISKYTIALDRAYLFMEEMSFGNQPPRICIRIVGRKKGDYHSVEYKPNLKIWRLRKSAIPIGLSTHCPIIFIRCVCPVWASLDYLLKVVYLSRGCKSLMGRGNALNH